MIVRNAYGHKQDARRNYVETVILGLDTSSVHIFFWYSSTDLLPFDPVNDSTCHEDAPGLYKY